MLFCQTTGSSRTVIENNAATERIAVIIPDSFLYFSLKTEYHDNEIVPLSYLMVYDDLNLSIGAGNYIRSGVYKLLTGKGISLDTHQPNQVILPDKRFNSGYSHGIWLTVADTVSLLVENPDLSPTGKGTALYQLSFFSKPYEYLHLGGGCIISGSVLQFYRYYPYFTLSLLFSRVKFHILADYVLSTVSGPYYDFAAIFEYSGTFLFTSVKVRYTEPDFPAVDGSFFPDYGQYDLKFSLYPNSSLTFTFSENFLTRQKKTILATQDYFVHHGQIWLNVKKRFGTIYASTRHELFHRLNTEKLSESCGYTQKTRLVLSAVKIAYDYRKSIDRTTGFETEKTRHKPRLEIRLPLSLIRSTVFFEFILSDYSQNMLRSGINADLIAYTDADISLFFKNEISRSNTSLSFGASCKW